MWLRAAARTIIAQENVLTTTPNLVFDEHWRVGMIGYCLGDKELIEWALRDPGRHGPSRGGFYPVMDTMIRDEPFWAEAPIYALHYDVYGMFALAEAALRHDGTDRYGYASAKSGASLKKIVDGYEPRWLNWTAEGIAHSTLLIDNESPSPGKQATRHDFTPEVKFFAVEGSAFERSVQERALLGATRSYGLGRVRSGATPPVRGGTRSVLVREHLDALLVDPDPRNVVAGLGPLD
jgi:hypothetical protein